MYLRTLLHFRSNTGSDFKNAFCRVLTSFWTVVAILCVSRFSSVCAGSQYIAELIGNELKASDQGVDFPGVVVLLNSPFPVDGVVYAFQAYFRNLDPTVFQIWRPLSDDTGNMSFALVGEIQTTPSTNEEPIYITSKFLKCIRVRRGDRLGIYSLAKQSSVGYVFNPFTSYALVYLADNSTGFQLGQAVTFTSITFPYDLSCQAFYYLETVNSNSSNETFVDCPPSLSVNDVGNGVTTTPAPIPSGQPGATGPEGPIGVIGGLGAAGYTGQQGSTGATGQPGNMGSTGPIGPPGPQGIPGIAGNTGDTGNTGPTIQGPSGQPGQAGRPGPPGHLIVINASEPHAYESSLESSDWSNKWTSELFMIGLLIWLAIISCIVLILILSLFVITCVIAALRRRDDQILAKIKQFHRHQNDPYETIRKTLSPETELSSSGFQGDSPDDTIRKGDPSSDVPTMDAWMGAMKDDSVQEYKMWYGVH